jgi:hypothetical protein
MRSPDVRFSNRRFGVKRFQTIHHCSVDVARGLVLLFGIGRGALPSWDSRTRRDNLWGGLAVRQRAGPSGHANSPYPSSREGRLSTAMWISGFLALILRGPHAWARERDLSEIHRYRSSVVSLRASSPASPAARATRRCGWTSIWDWMPIRQMGHLPVGLIHVNGSREASLRSLCR